MGNYIARLAKKWNVWKTASVNRSIFNAALMVSVLTATIKIITVAKDMLVASKFGVGDVLDIFLIAYLIPSFATSIFAGSFYSAFIPVLIRVQEQHGHEEAKRLFSSISFIAIILLIIVTFILAVTDSWVLNMLASGFDEEKLKNTLSQYDQLLVLIVIGGMTIFGGSVLNAQKKFSLVAISPVTSPLVIFLLLSISNDTQASHLLIKGTLAGAVLEFLIIIWGLHKIDYLCIPKWGKLNSDSIQVINQYLPMIGGSFLMSSTLVVDQTMAAWLAPGSVSTLAYAGKVPTFFTGLAASALGAAILPYLSQMVSKNDYIALKHTFLTYTKLLLAITIPVTISGIYFSMDLVELLFKRGAFDANASASVSFVQQCYLFQIPSYILGILAVRLLSSLSKNQVIIKIAAINFFINVLGDYILIKFMGVSGIALSTSIVYTSSTTMCFAYIFYLLKNKA